MGAQMKPTKGQKQILDAEQHLLVTGGPGSGKTTICIYKAAKYAENYLSSDRRILFLSFARATISRLTQAIELNKEITPEQKRQIAVETYHSFFWRILKTHGYLIELPRRISILNPSEEAIELSDIRLYFSKKIRQEKQRKRELEKARKTAEAEERVRLAFEEGRICFDLFAHLVAKILEESERIRHLISLMFPVIILDEFQDTDSEQWRIVRSLGKVCILNALADPEQRIYEFIGADPARLDQFRQTFEPTEVNLGTENHRNAETEIAVFGNDLLTGKFRQSKYNGIIFECYESHKNAAQTKILTTIYEARRRLINQGQKNWSLAVLVPTKKMTRFVSETLNHPLAGMPKVPHFAVIDWDAAILGAEVISYLMHPFIGEDHFSQFVDLICNYFKGKGGDSPTQKAIDEAAGIRKAFNDFMDRIRSGKPLKKSSKLVNTMDVYSRVKTLIHTGVPDDDWRTIRQFMEDGNCIRLNEIAKESKNLRILERGNQLRQDLFQDWLDNGSYFHALSITRQTFMREHFSTNSKPETGVTVMNMHKAKGKQFDEVIIFEGWPVRQPGKSVYNPDRIVYSNSRKNINSQSRQNLRVSVTRAIKLATILTPDQDPCVLLLPEDD